MYVCSELRCVLPVYMMMMPLPLALLIQMNMHPKYLSTFEKLPPLYEIHCQPRQLKHTPKRVFGPSLYGHSEDSVPPVGLGHTYQDKLPADFYESMMLHNGLTIAICHIIDNN